MSHDLKKKYQKRNTDNTVLVVLIIAAFLLGAFYIHYKYESKLQTAQKIGTLHQQIEKYIHNNPDPQHESIVKSSVYWPSLKLYSSSYPQNIYRPLLSLVTEWNPDNPDPPAIFNETLQHFNYSNPEERAMAEQYRNAEVPFKLYDIPEFNQISERWTDQYLSNQMKTHGTPHVEKSPTNHFMYWNIRGHHMRDYVPPTEIVDMSFDQWLREARDADNNKITNTSTHYYFMTGALAGDHSKSFIARDLRLFSTRKNNFFITNVMANKGIQCRFSMRGIIAESHYDSGRNMVAMMRGAKRYILTPPHTCKQLAIIREFDHPSYRHSVLDWSDLNQAAANGFGKVDSIDTIVQKGEILYIPSYWLHYIISLRYSIQCNSRSGSPMGDYGLSDIQECMGGNIPGNPIARRYGKMLRKGKP